MKRPAKIRRGYCESQKRAPANRTLAQNSLANSNIFQRTFESKGEGGNLQAGRQCQNV